MESGVFTPSTSWQQVTLTFTGDSTSAMRIHLYFAAGGGTIYYDDVQVQLLNSVGDTTITTHKFTGDERDPETNLDHTWFRNYSSQFGRWTTADPAGLMAVSLDSPQTLNRYSYVNNMPLTYFDPDGLIKDCPPGSGRNITNSDGTTSCGPGPHEGGVNDAVPCKVLIVDGFVWGDSCHAIGQSIDWERPDLKDRDKDKKKNDLGCVQSIFNPTCKPPTCLEVFSDSAAHALDLPALPQGMGLDDAARSLAAARVTAHIVSRGLSTPLRSSIVQNTLLAGEISADVIFWGPVLYQLSVGLVDEYKAWRDRTCRTVWSQ